MATPARSRDANLSLLDFYEKYYRPARHSGPANSHTCEQYRRCLRALAKPAHFAHWKTTKRPGTKLTVRELFPAFQGWYHDNELRRLQTKVADLSDELVDEARCFLIEAGRTRTTTNKVRRHVNAVWKMAFAKGLVDRLPQNEKYPCDVDEPVALTTGELKRILATAKLLPGTVGGISAALFWPAAILYLYSTGIRVGAALQVPTKNIDWDRGEVVIPAAAQKHRKEQRLDLFPSALEAIRLLRLEERGVPTVLGDWPYRPNALRKHYRRILVAAELFPDVKSVPRTYLFHCLRKTLASQLYEKAGIHVACARLGHSTPQVTQRYIDPRYKEAPNVRKLLADPLGVAG